MRKRSIFRQVLALLAAASLWLAVLPWSALAAREADGVFRKLSAPEELASGQYVLVDAGGLAPLGLDTEKNWISTAEPVLEADTVTDPMGAVWTLTVTGGGVLLQDANGVFLAPGPDGRVLSEEYVWSVTWNGDTFSFHGTNGDAPVTLVRNKDTDYRVMEDTVVEAFPEGYPSRFALYRKPSEPTPEETTEETTENTTGSQTEASTEPTTGPPTQPTAAPTEDLPPLAAGNYVLWSPADGIALSSRRVSEGSQDYAGTALTLSGGTPAGYTAAEIWSLAWEGSACILCCGEEALGTHSDNTGISYGTGDTRWVLEPRENGFLVRNAVSGLYVRYSPGFGLWTSTDTEGGATVLCFTPAQNVTEPEALSTEPPQSPTAAVAMTPDGGPLFPGTVTLTCETAGAVIYYATSPDGGAYSEFVPYSEPISLPAGFGTSYIKAYAQADNALPSGETVRCFTEQAAKGRGLYFGRLHTHSGVSDLAGPAEAVFSEAAQTPNMDFLAVTDHSDSFTNALLGKLSQDGTAVSPEWAAGKAAAQAATTRDFVGIYGYEMTWPQGRQLGHISTFCTPGFQTRDQQAYSGTAALPNYYDALASVPGSISQFNHPGTLYGSFQDFDHYSEARDQAIQLLEVGSGTDAYAYYIQALDKGWHLAPAGGSGEKCRTVVLADSLTEAGIYDAIRNYRVYATEDPDLEITYTLDGYPMGTILKKRDVGNSVTLYVSVSDPTDGSLCQAAVVTGGGQVLEEKVLTSGSGSFTLSPDPGYYFLRITQPDGNTAVTAPVWIDGSADDAGILAFTADDTQPKVGQAVNLTLTLYNRESMALEVTRIAFTVDGELAATTGDITQVDAGGTASCTLPLTWDGAGSVEVTALVTAVMAGQSRTYEASLTLHVTRAEAETGLLSIGEARKSEAGTPCILRGYVTAGNSDPYNTFPNTLYLQDETGGIAITGITASGIEIGTALEVEGTINQEDGNAMLEVLAWKSLEGDRYRYVAKSLPLGEAMNLFLHGGELLKIEGTVASVTPLDTAGVSRFTLVDGSGNLATVDIESGIGSGSTGRNELGYVVKAGRTIRAAGILYAAPDGTPALRVRNCDEVVYVPSLPYASQPSTGTNNPSTSDPITPYLLILPLSLFTLLLLTPNKRRK